MQLLNYTEISVREHLDEIRETVGLCRCDGCYLDVCAIALNNMKPRYVVSEQGVLFAKLREFDSQYNTDIMVAIKGALDTVKTTPKHCYKAAAETK